MTLAIIPTQIHLNTIVCVACGRDQTPPEAQGETQPQQVGKGLITHAQITEEAK